MERSANNQENEAKEVNEEDDAAVQSKSQTETKNEYVTKEEFEEFRDRVMANIRGVRKPELKKEDDDE